MNASNVATLLLLGTQVKMTQTALWVCILLTSLLAVAMTSEIKVELTRLDTIFLPPTELTARGVNEIAFDKEQKLFYTVGECACVEL